MIIENEEYLTVAEISARAGISRQTGYNRLKNEWQPYAREIDGKTYVSVKALSNEPLQLDKEFDSDLTDKLDSDLTKNCQTECQIDSPKLSNPLSNADDNLTNHWTAIIDELKAVVEDKKAEIERLRTELTAERTRSAELERRLLEYADRFADMAQREQELTRNAQNLHAIAEVRNEPPELTAPEDEEPHGIRGWFRRRAGK